VVQRVVKDSAIEWLGEIERFVVRQHEVEVWRLVSRSVALGVLNHVGGNVLPGDAVSAPREECAGPSCSAAQIDQILGTREMRKRLVEGSLGAFVADVLHIVDFALFHHCLHRTSPSHTLRLLTVKGARLAQSQCVVHLKATEVSPYASTRVG
jgi:hypothetical protein